ncbi:MAG: spore maturation protein [Eubacteriales bacterium]|nr:spore maturation protein [Eubacteriales bacterium]
MTEILIPVLLAIISTDALLHRVDIMPTLLRGVQTGLQTALHILPTMIAILTAVRMLRASGFIDLAGQALAPLLQQTGIPVDCAALVLLKPLSGSGGLALGQEIMRTCGVDSYAGRVAAVMLGASETSLYTISIYCGHLELKQTRYAIPAALFADLAAFISAAAWVRWLG